MPATSSSVIVASARLSLRMCVPLWFRPGSRPHRCRAPAAEPSRHLSRPPPWLASRCRPEDRSRVRRHSAQSPAAPGGDHHVDPTAGRPVRRRGEDVASPLREPGHPQHEVDDGVAGVDENRARGEPYRLTTWGPGRCCSGRCAGGHDNDGRSALAGRRPRPAKRPPCPRRPAHPPAQRQEPLRNRFQRQVVHVADEPAAAGGKAIDTLTGTCHRGGDGGDRVAVPPRDAPRRAASQASPSVAANTANAAGTDS